MNQTIREAEIKILELQVMIDYLKNLGCTASAELSEVDLVETANEAGNEVLKQLK